MNQNTIKPGMNSESKARFFAQYMLQDIIIASDNDPHTYGVQPYSLSLIRKGNNSTRLLLTPLSDITDEDAIEVEFESAQHFNKCLVSYGEEFNDLILKHNQIDFLRSKGYALPWMGYSVEDLVSAGWVKLKRGK